MMDRRYILFLSSLLSACASRSVEVSFPQMLQPAGGFAQMNQLAVSLDPALGEALKKDVMDELKACPLYKTVKLIDKPLSVEGKNSGEFFEAYLKKSGVSLRSHGILNVQVEHSEESVERQPAQVMGYFDQPKHEWVPSFGIPRVGVAGVPDLMELAPDTKARLRKAKEKTLKVQKVLRIYLYNSNLHKVVVDRVSNNRSTLASFSRRPGLRKAGFQKMIDRNILSEIVFSACPIQGDMVRRVHRAPDTVKEAATINAGVDLTETDWSAAAGKWTDALENDPKNVYAHHNLGVAFEREGDVLEALKHYRQVRKRFGDAYSDLLTQFIPQEEDFNLYPQVSFITGGNWVFVSSQNVAIQPINASVFRMTTVVDSQTQKPIGLNLREIGTLRFVADGEDYRLARIREFLADTPVKAGDAIIFDDPKEKPEDSEN